MASATPVWSDNVSVVAMAVLNNNAGANFLRRGTLDLRTKFGARLFTRMGPVAATVPAAAINVLIRPVLNNGAAPGTHPVAVAFAGSIAARNTTTLSAGPSAGALTIAITTATGFVRDDICIITDSISAPTKIEFIRIAKIVTTTITLDCPLIQAFSSGATISRVADVFQPIWLPGGSLYEVIFDYGAAATGSDYIVQAVAQTYDSDTIV